MISHQSGSFSNSCENADQRDKNDDTESFSRESLSWTKPYTRKRNEGLRNSIRNGSIQTYSPCSKRKVADNAKKSKDNVSESIRRGRAALAEAEEHIKIFEEYLRSSSSQEKTGETKAQCEAQITHTPQIVSEELPSLCAPLSKADSVTHPTVIHQHETCQLGSTDLMKNILKEGEERCKRDEIIAAAFRQGDVKLNAGRQVLKLIEQDGNQRCNFVVNSRKQLRSFDPSNLAATRRCALKAAKVAEEKAAHDAQEIRQSNFKARPLPGGVWVKNDPYALTKSALSKISSGNGQNTDGSATNISETSVIVSAGGVTSKTEASLILNNSSKQLSPQCSEASHTDDDGGKNRSGKRRRDCDKEDLVRKERMYKAVTKMIMNEFAAEGSTEDFLSEEDDILGMRQHIAKLKAQLKFKRKQCIKVIDAIDDERKKWDNSNDDDSSIFGDIDVSVSESITDNNSERKEVIGKVACNTGQSKVNKFTREPVQSALYERHQSWFNKLEKRRMKAIAQKDNEALMNMTGKPELNNNNASWIRAKAEHDEISEVQRAKEKALQEKRNTKEKLVQQKESDEADRLQSQILKNNNEIRKKISKRQQSKYVKKLACPSSIQQRAICPVKSEEIDKRKTKESESSCQIEPEMKKYNDKDKMEGTACSTDKCGKEISFAEMGDKEFERMVKKLGLQARKGQHIMKNRRTKMRDTVIHDISIETDPPQSKEHVNLLMMKQDNTPKVSNLKTKNLIKSVSKTGRFTSSAAQARLIVELKDTDLHEYTIATSRSALDAAENEGTLQLNEKQLQQHSSNSSSNDCREEPKLLTGQQEEPYERFEAGKSRFFDRSSSTEKGRFRVRDARNFAPDTMRRVPAQNEGSNGVMLLVGKRRCEGENEFSEELVITVLFDRSLFCENTASEWWYSNKEYFIPDEKRAV